MLTNTADLFRGFLPVRRSCLLCLGVLTLILGASCATAQDIDLPDKPLAEPNRWLTDQRWSELRYGLSIRQPHDAVSVPDTAQGDVIRWALANRSRVSLSFARGAYERVFKNPDGTAATKLIAPKVDIIQKQISDELKASAGQVINTRANQVVELDSLGGVINYYIIKPPQRDAKPYFYGVALLQLDQLSVAVLKLECLPDQMIEAISTFECMVHSVEVEEAKQVNERLHGWLENAEELLAELTQEDRLKTMRDDRLYRVLENNKDIGYTRIWQRYQDKAYYKALKAKRGEDADRLEGIDRFEAEGNAIFIQSRLEGQGIVMQHRHESIDTPGKPVAYWQIKNALQYKNDPNNLRAGTWVETGVRGVAMIGGKRMDHLQLTREGTPPRHMVEYLLQRERDPERRLRYPSADPRSYPSGEVIEKAWPTPKRAFLSPVDAALMPALLPNEEKTYAFSAYHQETSRIDFRLMRVEPRADGGKTVYLRPVLDLSEQALVFDANNELVSHTYPDGRSLKKTTRQELARIWGVRLRD
ncbi:MAG: hypothetical protein KTR15_12985 [Phycisphaeraceae bacterium]|nr:hypothetical protein [Phycisphaeraceae bacterium]